MRGISSADIPVGMCRDQIHVVANSAITIVSDLNADDLAALWTLRVRSEKETSCKSLELRKDRRGSEPSDTNQGATR
jgi:hypothetical protein